MSWRLHARIKALTANRVTYRYPNLHCKVDPNANPFLNNPCKTPFYYRNDESKLACYDCFTEKRTVDEWIDAITGLHNFEITPCESGVKQ